MFSTINIWIWKKEEEILPALWKFCCRRRRSRGRASVAPGDLGSYPEIFSAREFEDRRLGFLLLLIAGDIESNLCPRQIYICPVCSNHVTSNRKDKGSVLSCQCKDWVHIRCTTLPNTRHHTNTWACPRCTNQSQTTTKSRTTTINNQHNPAVLQ